MVNIEVLQELHKFSSLYEERWGREVDYIGMPANISQERLLLALRYAADTGDSVLVSLHKIRDILREYHDYLEKQHAIHGWNLESGHTFDRVCPLCGNKVKFIKIGNSYSYTCETKLCFNSVFRGI